MQNQVKLLDQNDSIKTREVSFEQDTLMVDGVQVPYSKQVLTTQFFYITDLLIDIQTTQQIDQFDQCFFLNTINRMLATQIDANHSSIGLTILQQMNNLGVQTYYFLLQKVSLSKFKAMLLDNQFFIHLFLTFHRLIHSRRLTDEQILILRTILIEDLPEHYQRLFYFIDSIENKEHKLTKSLLLIANQQIIQIIEKTNFIHNLAYEERKENNLAQFLRDQVDQQKIIDVRFLQKLLNIIISLQGIVFVSYEIQEKYDKRSENFVQQYIMTKECFAIIIKHFNLFCNQEPSNLSTVLLLISMYRPKYLWQSIVSSKQKSLSSPNVNIQIENRNNFKMKNEIQQENTAEQSKNKFKVDKIKNKQQAFIQFSGRQLLDTKYLSFWPTNTLILLKLVKFMPSEIKNIFIQLLQQLLVNRLKVNQLQLITSFIKETLKRQHEKGNIQILILSLVAKISQQIAIIFQEFSFFSQKDENRKHKQQNDNITQCFIIFPKIDSVLICAIFRTFELLLDKNTLHILKDFDYITMLQKLLTISRNRKGMIMSSRLSFKKKLYQYIQLIQQKNTRVSKNPSRNITIQKERLHYNKQKIVISEIVDLAKLKETLSI